MVGNAVNHPLFCKDDSNIKGVISISKKTVTYQRQTSNKIIRQI